MATELHCIRHCSYSHAAATVQRQVLLQQERGVLPPFATVRCAFRRHGAALRIVFEILHVLCTDDFAWQIARSPGLQFAPVFPSNMG